MCKLRKHKIATEGFSLRGKPDTGRETAGLVQDMSDQYSNTIMVQQMSRVLHWPGEIKCKTLSLLLCGIKMLTRTELVTVRAWTEQVSGTCHEFSEPDCGQASQQNSRGQPIKKKYDSFRMRGHHRISILGTVVSYAIDHDYHLTCNSILGEEAWFG